MCHQARWTEETAAPCTRNQVLIRQVQPDVISKFQPANSFKKLNVWVDFDSEGKGVVYVHEENLRPYLWNITKTCTVLV